MKYLFSRSGLAALAELDPDRTLFAFDFDGTLAAETRLPDEARTDITCLNALKKLSRKAHVSVISGRRLQDLRPKLGFRPASTLGNHGLESPWSKKTEQQASRQVNHWLEALHEAWPFARDRGVFIENKRSSISLHYRLAKNPARARRRLLKLIEELNLRARIVGGKFVINLTLPKAPHKGTALLQLMKRQKVKRALFAGDDVTDEDVFRLRKKNILTIRVGRKAGSAAQFYLRDQKEMARLLRHLSLSF
ncbi:MAG: trehalose-phosphatase [Bdellovibrionales bacterium]|nr:trehalose-phosphatase [Bdellovibrionales bacterium]